MKKIQNIDKMQITESAFNEIVNFIGAKPAESGGALFGREDDYVIRKFVPDVNAKTSRATYTINTDYLNPVIKKLWEEDGLSLIGIVHSHPNGLSSLSRPDLHYFGDLLKTSLTRRKFFAPIVFTIPDGGFKLFPHILNNEGGYSSTAQLDLVPDGYGMKAKSKQKNFSGIKGNNRMKIIKKISIDGITRIEVLLLKTLGFVFIGYVLIRVVKPFTNYLIKMLSI